MTTEAGNNIGKGIIVCGLNGTGKSTLGKALAEKLNFHFIDSEELYFGKKGTDYTYGASRTRDEVEALLMKEIKEHKDFVFCSVKGDYGERFYPFFRYAVLIEVPKDIRMRRIKERSFRQFGNRMLPGGDLYEQEERFFEFAGSRAENTVEKWVCAVNCPVIRIDGTKTIEENVDFIAGQL